MPRSVRPAADSPYPPGWEPFLAAINADLDDDTRRLVFADWLQENGDEPRAAFIRLQCAAAREGNESTAGAEALLEANRARWLVGLPKWCRERSDCVAFRRGFVGRVTASGKQWVADGETIRRLAALESLFFERVWNTVLERPSLAGLRMLLLPSAGSALIESLAASPVLPSLAILSITGKSSDGVSQRSFRRLLASPDLACLRHFRLWRVPLGNAVAEALGAARFAALEELRLSTLGVDTSGAQALARAPCLAELRELDLARNPIGDDGLAHLLTAPALRSVEKLDLGHCDLTSASAHTLAEWEGLRSVRKLNLLGNRLRRADAELIAASPHAVSLTDFEAPLRD